MPPSEKSHQSPWSNQILGSVFFALYLANATFLTLHHGLAQGGLLWYHLLAFLGFGLGLTLNNRSLVISTLALSLPQEVVWLTDHIARITTGQSPFNLMEALFQPGLSATEFTVAHVHYLYFPAAFSALKRVTGTAKYPLQLTTGLHLLFYACSYYFFTADSDPNCARLSCIPILDKLSPGIYPFAYGIAYYALALALTKLLLTRSSATLFLALSSGTSTLIYVALTLCSLSRASWIYTHTPRFHCQGSEATEGVSIQCLRTSEYGLGYLRLTFGVRNRAKRATSCALYISDKVQSEKKERMYESVLLRGNSHIELSVTVPYPKAPEGVTAVLTTNCIKLP